ncbi:MAG: polyphosphate:AMP phosphotransferase [Candidatus Zixiibacteriota bacterium]
MFEAVELGQSLSKSEFEEQLPQLRTELLRVQRALAGTDSRLLLIIAGMDAAGKGECVNRLSEWLDMRGIDTHTYWLPSDEERERPPYWRYWRTFPARGQIGIHFAAWYQDLIPRFAERKIDVAQLDAELARAAFVERMLVEDKTLILKFWLHLSEEEQEKRLKALATDPLTRRRVTKSDWKHHKHYDRYVAAVERVIRLTSTGQCPWTLIDASNWRHRDMTIGRTILSALSAHLANGTGPAHPAPNGVFVPATSPENRITILDGVDLSKTCDADSYEKRLRRYQGKINRLTWQAYEAKRSSVVVFEGWDAAGKGGSIRRLTATMDARLKRIISVAAPTDEEKAHHYLWRFWRHVPRAGFVTAYDRSWYGRVLVERVEGFATPTEWQRAYQEINEFEEQLAAHGIVLTKFFLHISKDKQYRRFKAREQTPHKQHKITEEDWRNREKWDAYEAAVNEMVARTSTEYAPWYLIPADDKRYARIEVLKIYAKRLNAALKSR